MTKWEYKYELFDKLEASEMIKLNKIGKEGWEMVSFTSVGRAFDDGSSYTKFSMIFKRPIK
jgi:hypothetical protein